MVKASTLMSWFIIIIMIASTVGFAVYYVGNEDPGSGSGTDQNVPPLQDTTQIQFSASNVDADVIDSLPAILLVAETNEAEINKIDSEIYLADGNVRQVLSSYLPAQGAQTSSSKALLYRAEISLAPKADAEKIISRISSDSNYLSGVQAVKSVLVRVPKKVAFRNSDLNLEKEYEFSETTVQAFASPGTMNGDELKVTLNASFRGQELVQVSALEQENVSGKLSEKTVSLEAPIAELQPTLLVSAQQVSFSNITPVSDLVNTFASLPDVNGSSFSIPRVQPQVLLSASGLDENQIIDLNGFVLGLRDLNSAQTQKISKEFSATLSFSSDLNSLAAQRSAIVEKLREMNVSSESFDLQESRTALFGTISLKSASSARELYGTVGAGLLAKGVLAKIYQPARLLVYKLVDQDTNIATDVPGQGIDAEVIPTHALDENVSVKVQIAVQRGKLVYAQAIEPQ